MPTQSKELMTRLSELVEERGHQWKQIAPILAAEGYRDARGEPYSDNYLRHRMKKHEAGNHEKRSDRSERGKPAESSEPDIPDLARAVVSLLIQNGLLASADKEVLDSLERTPPVPEHEMPPQPLGARSH